MLSTDVHRWFLRLLSARAIIECVNQSADPPESPDPARRSSDPRRHRPRALVLAPALGGLVGLSLLAAACGSSPGGQVAQLGSTTTHSSPSRSAAASAQANGVLAFSYCMRAHGVPHFPDPTSGGELVKESLQQLGVSSSRFQAAASACNSLLPNGGSGPNPAQLQQERAQALSFSECVRSHGVANFPDPASNGRIPDPATVGVNQGSPKFQTANQACAKYRPPYVPSNAAYNAYARATG
jgi:hypothetical protein